MIVKNISNKVNSIMAPIFFNNLVVKKNVLSLFSYDSVLKKIGCATIPRFFLYIYIPIMHIVMPI